MTQNFLAQHEIGRRFHIDPSDLPPPKTGPIVTDRSLIVPYSGQVPQVPPGFTATPFATGLVNPRRLLVLPNGDVLLAEQSAGYLTLLRDDGSGHATWIDRHVEDLNKPYGLAWRDNHVLVADQDGIWSVPHNLGALRAGSSETKRVDQVPLFGIVQGHQNRHLVIDPKTGALFVGVGSSGNLGVEPEPKATSNASMQTVPIKQHLPPAHVTRLRSHSTQKAATFMRWCKSATVLVTSCHPIISSACNKEGFTDGHTPTSAVRVPFKDGRPEGYYENFTTGFWVSGEQRAEVWGRPAALAVAKDGSLLVADDTGGTIWCIAYTGTGDRAAAHPDRAESQR